jgi:hypothetical protein
VKAKVKTKLHFNRIAMQRGKPEVWTAHNSRGCFGAEKLVIMHDGKESARGPIKPANVINNLNLTFSANGQHLFWSDTDAQGNFRTEYNLDAQQWTHLAATLLVEREGTRITIFILRLCPLGG